MSTLRYYVPDSDRAAAGCWRVFDRTTGRECCRHSKRRSARDCARERNAQPEGLGIDCTGIDLVVAAPIIEPQQLQLDGSSAELQAALQAEREKAAQLITEVNHFEAKSGRLEAELDDARRALNKAQANIDALTIERDGRLSDLERRNDAIIRRQAGELAVLNAVAEVANDDRVAG